MRHLGVEPGSVTVFGLVSDAAHGVELFVDRDVWNVARWRCHPLREQRDDRDEPGGHRALSRADGAHPRVLSLSTRTPGNP